ncbi:MAG: tetratricopeptide repeat protein [Bdellovibrionota bacterium]
MARLSPDVIEKYKKILKGDPQSLIFASLADAYRENRQLPDAEALAREGVQRHPHFARGWVVLGRILQDRGQMDEAIAALEKAVRLEPDNLLAHQVMGDLFLAIKNSKEALRSYKKVLFLNPLAAKARKVVEKLESQTAADYDDETFVMASADATSMQKLGEVAKRIQGEIQGKAAPQQLLRLLSLVDAFIARNDFSKALEIVDEGIQEWGEDSELTRRRQFLRRHSQAASMLRTSDEPVLKPSLRRTKELQQLKAQRLEALLQKVQKIKQDRDNSIDPAP